jgi:hypothetical protein
MHRTNIYLEQEQCEALDRLAAEEGTSRADLIRRLLDRALAGHSSDLSSDLAAIEGSFGALADFEPAERQPDERSLHLDRVWRLGA